jgi:hypothetical protein
VAKHGYVELQESALAERERRLRVARTVRTSALWRKSRFEPAKRHSRERTSATRAHRKGKMAVNRIFGNQCFRLEDEISQNSVKLALSFGDVIEV